MCTPATFLRIHSAAFADASGPTPASTYAFSRRPMSRTCAIKVFIRSMSKQYWVWMNCAPAAIFFAMWCGRKSKGGAKGFAAPPKNSRGGALMARPLRNCCSSRMWRTMPSAEMLSISNTGLASGWSPDCTPSPLRQRMLHTPIAAAPRISPCMAMRLRSRQDCCRIMA